MSIGAQILNVELQHLVIFLLAFSLAPGDILPLCALFLPAFVVVLFTFLFYS